MIVLRCYCQLYCNFWASLVGLPALLALVFLIIHISTRTCHVLLIARLTRCSEKMWSVFCLQVRFISISWLLCTVLMICNLTMFYVKLIFFFVLRRTQLCASLVVTFLPEILNEIGLFCCDDLWDRDGFCGAHYFSALVYDHIARLHQVLRVLLRKLPNLLHFIEILCALADDFSCGLSQNSCVRSLCWNAWPIQGLQIHWLHLVSASFGLHMAVWAHKLTHERWSIFAMLTSVHSDWCAVQEHPGLLCAAWA